MLKEAILRIGAAAVFCVTGCQNAALLAEAQILGDGGGKVYKTREDVIALFPTAQWLEAKQDEARFMFCAIDLPAYGNSKIEVHGWAFQRHLRVWESVLTVRLNGVGDVKLSVDPKTGLFLVKGSANNKFKDQSVCTFDLRAGQ